MKTRLPWLTLSLAAAAIAIHLLPATADWLQYDRAAIGRGELWRLVTAHLVHFSANHLAWDLSVLLGFGIACERRSRETMAMALVASAVVISTALALGQPQFEYYRGLSGVDCALVGVAASSLLRHRGPVACACGVLTLVGFSAKCLYELATAQTVFATGVGYAPVPLAHLAGLLVGMAAAWAVSRDVTDSSQFRRRSVAETG